VAGALDLRHRQEAPLKLGSIAGCAVWMDVSVDDPGRAVPLARREPYARRDSVYTSIPYRLRQHAVSGGDPFSSYLPLLARPDVQVVA
jgi:hypothetical protein